MISPWIQTVYALILKYNIAPHRITTYVHSWGRRTDEIGIRVGFGSKGEDHGVDLQDFIDYLKSRDGKYKVCSSGVEHYLGLELRNKDQDK